MTSRGDAQGDDRPEHEKGPGRGALAPNQGGPMLSKHRSVMLWLPSADEEVTEMLGRAPSGRGLQEAAACLSPRGLGSYGDAA